MSHLPRYLLHLSTTRASGGQRGRGSDTLCCCYAFGIMVASPPATVFRLRQAVLVLLCPLCRPNPSGRRHLQTGQGQAPLRWGALNRLHQEGLCFCSNYPHATSSPLHLSPSVQTSCILDLVSDEIVPLYYALVVSWFISVRIFLLHVSTWMVFFTWLHVLR
jgi:hypothetical protein